MRNVLKNILNSLKSPGLKLIWQSSKVERTRIFLLSVLYIVSAFISLANTLVMKNLVDSAVQGDIIGIRNYALLLAGTMLVNIAIGYIRNMGQIRAKTNLLRSMRRKMLNKLMYKQYSDLQSYHSGEMVNRFFSDVNVVCGGVMHTVPPMLYLIIELVGAVVILGRMDTQFMWIMLIAGAIGAFGSFAFRKKMKALHKDQQLALDKFHARIQEILGNLRIIKASSTEKRMEAEADRSHQQYAMARVRQERFSSCLGVGLGLVFRGSWLYALLWGCLGISRGTFTYGTLTAILQLVGQIQSPFEGMISTLGSAYGSISSAERLLELYDLRDEAPQPEMEEQPKSFEEIRLEQVAFSYDREAEILRGVDLVIRPGDTAAIMGPSGCGKSTLFLLLLGIYQPESGSIQVKLEDRQIEGSLRSLFSYVPQGNALFSGTLRENIGMFCPDMPTDEEIWRAAHMACIDEFIREQAQGLDTMIGERGLGLSEGQAQRIAIARALLTEAPVLLLDEATSALDEQTEAQLLENIAALKNRTCLIVTHRRAALNICNKQWTLSEGKMIQNAG